MAARVAPQSPDSLPAPLSAGSPPGSLRGRKVIYIAPKQGDLPKLMRVASDQYQRADQPNGASGFCYDITQSPIKLEDNNSALAVRTHTLLRNGLKKAILIVRIDQAAAAVMEQTKARILAQFQSAGLKVHAQEGPGVVQALYRDATKMDITVTHHEGEGEKIEFLPHSEMAEVARDAPAGKMAREERQGGACAVDRGSDSSGVLARGAYGFDGIEGASPRPSPSGHMSLNQKWEKISEWFSRNVNLFGTSRKEEGKPPVKEEVRRPPAPSAEALAALQAPQDPKLAPQHTYKLFLIGLIAGFHFYANRKTLQLSHRLNEETESAIAKNYDSQLQELARLKGTDIQKTWVETITILKESEKRYSLTDRRSVAYSLQRILADGGEDGSDCHTLGALIARVEQRVKEEEFYYHAGNLGIERAKVGELEEHPDSLLIHQELMKNALFYLATKFDVAGDEGVSILRGWQGELMDKFEPKTPPEEFEFFPKKPITYEEQVVLLNEILTRHIKNGLEKKRPLIEPRIRKCLIETILQLYRDAGLDPAGMNVELDGLTIPELAGRVIETIELLTLSLISKEEARIKEVITRARNDRRGLIRSRELTLLCSPLAEKDEVDAYGEFLIDARFDLFVYSRTEKTRAEMGPARTRMKEHQLRAQGQIEKERMLAQMKRVGAKRLTPELIKAGLDEKIASVMKSYREGDITPRQTKIFLIKLIQKLYKHKILEGRRKADWVQELSAKSPNQLVKILRQIIEAAKRAPQPVLPARPGYNDSGESDKPRSVRVVRQRGPWASFKILDSD